MLSGKIARTKKGKAVNALSPKIVVETEVAESRRAGRRARVRRQFGGAVLPSLSQRKKPWSWVRRERIVRHSEAIAAERARRGGA